MKNNKTYSLVISLISKSLLSLICSSFICNYAFAAAPTQSASKVRITYTADPNPANLIPIRILEGIEIWPAADERNITHYNVYWGDSMRNKLGLLLAPRLAHIPANYSGEKLVYEFPAGLKMEAGAIYVLVCTENRGQEYCGKGNNMEKVTDPLIDLGNTLSSLKSLVYFNNHLPGVKVMATCGDLVCNGVETPDSCPADCSDYQYASFNFQVLCNEVQGVFHPRSISEIQNLVKNARENNLRVKISSGQGYKTTSGSASSVVCTDGILLVMDQFDHGQAGLQMYLEKFEGVNVVNVAAGTNLHELGEWLYERGLGLGYVHLGWRHPSIAGAIGTSAHGSSPKHRGILAHSIVAMDVIGSDGELRTYSRGTTGISDPDLWAALKTHLGYMGVITRLRIETQAATNTHVKITFHEEDELFTNNTMGSVYNDIKECDYGQYNWFPSLNQYLRTCGKTTTAPAELGANNALLDPYVDLSQFSAQQTTQVLQIGAVDANSGANEKMEFMRRAGWHLTPILYKTINGQKRYTSNAIGPTHRMISSKLIDNLGREVFQMDWEVAVPAITSQAALEYIKSWSNGSNLKNRNIPVPLIGIFVRFSKVEDGTLLAYTGAGNNFEDGSIATHIEMPIFVPVGLNEAQMAEYMAPYEEAMKTLVSSYGARAHWGKNMYGGNPWIFKLQRDIGSYGDLIGRFNQQVAKIDPNGMFANKYAAAIGIQYPNFAYPDAWLPPGDDPSQYDNDNDGVPNNQDAFPNDPSETSDSDQDGVGDNADAFPNDPNETMDTDGDGVGDNADMYPNDPSRSDDSASNAFSARYVRISALSEVNGYPYSSAAEINLLNANGELIDRSAWTVAASNQEYDTPASYAIDGNNNTIWHTQWRWSSPAHTHSLTIDTQMIQSISAIRYLPRQDGNSNGTFAQYEVHLSNDGINWGQAIASGSLIGTQQHSIEFVGSSNLDTDGDGVPDAQDVFPNDPNETMDTDGDGVGDNADMYPNDPSRSDDSANIAVSARYVRISALSEVNGYPYSSAAEINLLDANGQLIDRSAWTVAASNQEYDTPASYVIDGNNNTIWHTQWRWSSPAHSHSLTIDTQMIQSISAIRYLPRQDGNSNGTFAQYEVHVSNDGINWGQAIASGSLNSTTSSEIEIAL